MKNLIQKLLLIVFVNCTATGCDKPLARDEVPEIYQSLQEPTDRSKDKGF